MSNKNVNQVEVNEKLVGEVSGGHNSAGFFCSISGECMGGVNCWDLLVYVVTH